MEEKLCRSPGAEKVELKYKTGGYRARRKAREAAVRIAVEREQGQNENTRKRRQTETVETP